MMAFLAANLDEMPVDQSLHDAMGIGPRNWQALAWEISGNKPTII